MINKTITKEELHSSKEFYINKIKNGVFVVPTDTIYGLSCNALEDESVKKVRAIKNQHNRPFSIIPPSKEWITQNCIVDEAAQEWVDKLPGPYTLILKLKNKDILSESVLQGVENVGVRIPNHWISDFANAADVPFITTSANISGDTYMTSSDDLHEDIVKNVDCIVYEGKIKGKPSTLVHLYNDEELVVNRD